MTYKKFPSRMFELVNTGGEIHLGKKQFQDYDFGEIEGVRLTMIFYRTDLFTSERFRIKTKLSYSAVNNYSEWITPATYISDFTSSNYWIGTVYLPFDSSFRFGLVPTPIDMDYWLETDSYSYSFGGTEIGVILDFIEDSETDLFNGRFEVKSDKLAYLSNFIRR